MMLEQANVQVDTVMAMGSSRMAPQARTGAMAMNVDAVDDVMDDIAEQQQDVFAPEHCVFPVFPVFSRIWTLWQSGLSI